MYNPPDISIWLPTEALDWMLRMLSGDVIMHVDGIQPPDFQYWFYTLYDLGWATWETQDVFYRYTLTEAGQMVYRNMVSHVEVNREK